MPDDVVIKVENLSKQYRIGAHEGYKTFRETLVDTVKVPFQRLSSLLSAPRSKLSSRDDTIWALKDVSFEVKQGEVVGIKEWRWEKYTIKDFIQDYRTD
jgi:lipopolysaccharide transport system ATP-binding protein